MYDTTLEVSNTLFQSLPAFGVRASIAFVILLITWLLARYSKRLILKITKLDEDFVAILAKIVARIIWVIGLFIAVGTLGIDLTALVTGLGLTGFALGFALKDVISNALSGALVMGFRCFEIGSYIEVGTLKGVVREIDLRYTILYSDDNRGRIIYIPNSMLFTNAIIVGRERQKPEGYIYQDLK